MKGSLGSMLLAGMLLAGAVNASGSAAKTGGPVIVAKPTSMMINTQIKLRGRGFDADTTLTLKECSVTAWSLPADPCATGNEVTVTTNAGGRFHTKMVAGLCPPRATPVVGPTPSTVPVGTERTCYIGALHPTGIDTVELLGAVGIEVSWP